MKNKIYFADLTHTGTGVNANMFPLGIGLVAAYVAREMKDDFQVSIYKYPEELNQTLSEAAPSVLCLSNYAWNANLAYAFAENVKRNHPEVITVFGGPNFPIAPQLRKDFLAERPAIDFHIKWDGEYALVSLLGKLLNHDLDGDAFKERETLSDNTCYLTGEGKYVEGPDHRVADLMTLPSPYLTGLFDKFFDSTLIPLLETTRGCPYSCTFCNDGHALRNRIYRKSEDIIREELRYIAIRSKDTVQRQLFFTDLNFGMYREDLASAETMRSVIDEFNWPDRFETSTGKSHPDRLLQVTKMVNDGGKGILKLGYSFQSTDSEVLGEIKRKNLSVDDLLGLRDYRFEQINANQEFFTELILALPGDNVEKHYNSLRDTIDVLGMNNIDIHQLTLLKGSVMADWDALGTRPQDQFDVRRRVFVGCLGAYDIGGETVPIAEIEDVVVGNSSLSFDDYLRCRITHLLIKIYIDHDPFNEVFGLVRGMGLSRFNLLLHLQDYFLRKYDSLSALIDSFVAGSQAPLFDDYDQINSFVNNLENIEKYVSGEYGQNELLTHRVKAYLECGDDMHEALREAAVSYIDGHGQLTDDIERYLEEGIRFSRLRRFDHLSYKTETAGEFTFDFLKAEELGYEVDPSTLKTTRVRLKAYYDSGDLETIDRLIDMYGIQTMRQIGKLFQRNNLLLLKRAVKEVELNEALER